MLSRFLVLDVLFNFLLPKGGNGMIRIYNREENNIACAVTEKVIPSNKSFFILLLRESEGIFLSEEAVDSIPDVERFPHKRGFCPVYRGDSMKSQDGKHWVAETAYEVEYLFSITSKKRKSLIPA